MKVHALLGCAPTPLAHYLKALGVLRLVAEQLDHGARGFWRDEAFFLITWASREELERFFLEVYAPSPLVAPWNGGSGFFPKDNKKGIDAIASSRAPRFAAYREAIQLGRSLTVGWPEAPKNEPKAALLQAVKKSARGPLADWFDAAVTLDDEGSPSYPALLGTGGNDGRLDFTNNFMQRLGLLFDLASENAAPQRTAIESLAGSLWSQPSRGQESGAIGQFFPGAAGGANSSEGFDGNTHLNTWDFILALEGSICFRTSVTRQASSLGRAQASAPFATRSMAAGFGSAALSDESSRGEQWMPLWDAPASWPEIRALFREGRSRLAGGGAESASEFARALSRMGTARGVQSFQRFGYQERNGQANLAVPLGRWRVTESSRSELLDDIARWIDSLRRASSDGNAPVSFERAARQTANSLLAACQDESPRVWQALLRQVVAAESLCLRNPKFTSSARLRPLPQLDPRWLDALDDGSLEFRLARALGNLSVFSSNQVRPLRNYWVPLDPDRPFQYLAGENTIRIGPEVVGGGRDLVHDCTAVLLRRALDPKRENGALGLRAQAGFFAEPADLLALLEERVNRLAVLELARGLMCVDWFRTRERRTDSSSTPEILPASFGILRLATPLEPSEDRDVRIDPAVLRHLSARSPERALAAAHRRLLAAGINPRTRFAPVETKQGPLLATALLFPLSPFHLTLLEDGLTKPKKLDDDSSPEMLAAEERNA